MSVGQGTRNVGGEEDTKCRWDRGHEMSVVKRTRNVGGEEDTKCRW
jgi:hypothetical protein